MAIRIGINGFGRIGRLFLRAATSQKDLNIVAINDLMDPATQAYLFKFDSVHGKYVGEVSNSKQGLVIDGTEIEVISERDPENLPWKSLGIDVVVESTGLFTEADSAAKHLIAGAGRVVISAPSNGNVPTVVMGINENSLSFDDRVISNASCTTNCLAPMVKVLNDAFGVERGLMTTIHSYTGEQRLVDAPHKDLRRARSAAVSIVPTTTGAASAVGKVIPELDGRLDGMAVRVPTPDGSFTDFVGVVRESTNEAAVNLAFKNAAKGVLKGILDYSVDPLVSSDIIGNPNSCIFDSQITKVMDKNLVKICGWYDNEWGYSNRCVDLVRKLANL